MSGIGDVLSKIVQLKCITEECGGKAREAVRFFGKTSYFNTIGSHSARAQSHLKELDF